jgi:nucleotide-binding universal stress UspA family protein
MDVFSTIVTVRITTARHGAGPLDELVVPVDGSDFSHRALPAAGQLAALLGARLRLLTTRTDVGDQSPTEYLEDLGNSLDVEAVTDVALDEPPAAAVAALTGARVGVCMATHARGRLLAGLHPNIADDVIAHVVGPVVLVGPHCRPGPPGDGPVLIAHDGTQDATARSVGLVELASALQRDIDVVHVVSAPSGRPNREPYTRERREMDVLCDLARRSGIGAEPRVVFAGQVKDGLMGETARSNPSLVAMVAHPHGRLERVRDGSVTMDVVHDAPVPVVVPGSAGT